MKVRPIPFSEEMVRAILGGRKTQTRRTIKYPSTGAFVCVKGYWTSQTADEWWPLVSADGESLLDKDGNETPMRCPYGKPGDHLWVREAWKSAKSLDAMSPAEMMEECRKAGWHSGRTWTPIEYLADGRRENWDTFHNELGRYRHARFMPRDYSRITLEITDVRVQRLQDISEEDARAEGVVPGCFECGAMPHTKDCYGRRDTYVDSFAWLWQSINGETSWHANPWVWALTFKQVTA